MIHDGIEFFNIDEMRPVDGHGGLRLQRVPEAVRENVDAGTAGVMLSPANCEIRFRLAPGQDSAKITLSSPEGATIFTYHGPFQGRSWQLEPEPAELQIKQHQRLAKLTEEQRKSLSFDPGLIRLCFGGSYPEPVFYHGHGEGICLPNDSDTPDKVYVAYGSSITHGADSSGAALSYAAHAAWRLGLDFRNLGASGCCLCEKAFADYLAEQPCDLMTLELSVNMLGRGFTEDEFRERASYLVKRVADADPRRTVVCITIFPHYNDMGDGFCEAKNATSEGYRQILRDIVKDLNLPNLHIVEGPDLLPDISGLSQDLIHPGARGMIQIGEELARRLATRPSL